MQVCPCVVGVRRRGKKLAQPTSGMGQGHRQGTRMPLSLRLYFNSRSVCLAHQVNPEKRMLRLIKSLGVSVNWFIYSVSLAWR